MISWVWRCLRDRALGLVAQWFGSGDWSTGSSAPGYRFDPDYHACADSRCGEVWSRIDGPICPTCGGPALERSP